MKKCRWYTDKETGERYQVPGCVAGVLNPHNCTCHSPRAQRKASMATTTAKLAKTKLVGQRDIDDVIDVEIDHDGDLTMASIEGGDFLLLSRKQQIQLHFFLDLHLKETATNG